MYTYDFWVERNTVGGGHFEVVTLYRDGKRSGRWVYDGTMLYRLAKRRRNKKIAELQMLYGATKR